MKDVMFFCERWGGNYKRPVGQMTPEKAKKRHAAGKPYSVLIGSDTQPKAEVFVGKNSAQVGFFDQNLNEYILYQFSRKNDENSSDRLFLNYALTREFNNNNEIKLAYRYIFKPDGRVHIDRIVLHPEPMEQDMDTTADLSENWSDYPEFGEYDDLLRIDRSPVK